jgi:hypothetical protein
MEMLSSGALDAAGEWGMGSFDFKYFIIFTSRKMASAQLFGFEMGFRRLVQAIYI